MALDKAYNPGLRIAAVTSSADVVRDLTSLARCRVKVWGSQAFYFMVSESEDSEMDLEAADKALGTADIPEEVAAGPQGVCFTVPHGAPYLHVRAVSTDAQIQVKQISDKQSGSA